jgi:hypothetical protein
MQASVSATRRAGDRAFINDAYFALRCGLSGQAYRRRGRKPNGTMRGGGCEWQRTVASRPWTRAERRVVVRGFLGRLSIAVEPLAVALFFTMIPVTLFLRKQPVAYLLTPIFAFGAIAFLAYAVLLVLPCLRALWQTFDRIYSVDGYVRYRGASSEYFAAVLDADRHVLGEWPLTERPRALDRRELWPALVEFCTHGGILRIDGRSTGVLPENLPPLGIGAAAGFAERRRNDPTGAEPSSS